MNTVPETDKVTVVVITRDRRADLERSLPHHQVPVVLVDNGSSDGTPAAVRERCPEVTVVEAGRNLGAVARNLGASYADTPYVAFADDDSWWAPGSLAQAARLLDAEPRLGLVAGSVLVGAEQRLDPVCVQMRDSPLPVNAALPGPAILGFPACGAVVRREAFLAVGGFDDVVFFLGEEERVALDLAANDWFLCYTSDLVAHHYPSPSRDPKARDTQVRRNLLLTAVMRRPWKVVARTAADLLREGPAGRRAVWAALRRLRRAIVCRRRLPAEVEHAVQLLRSAEAEVGK